MKTTTTTTTAAAADSDKVFEFGELSGLAQARARMDFFHNLKDDSGAVLDDTGRLGEFIDKLLVANDYLFSESGEKL